MALLHYDNINIAALACAVPEYTQKINEDPAFPQANYIRNFIRQIGIRQRQISLIEQTCTDLGYAAAIHALEYAGWDAQSLDALIFLSQMPDFNPGTGNAFILHKHLGLPKSALAFDITLGCSSFPYGLSVCASLLQQKSVNRILMISGDNVWPMSANAKSLLAENAFLFGEGTAATLLEKKSGSPMDIALFSDGSGYEYLFNPRAGSRNNWRTGDTIKLSGGQTIRPPGARTGQYMDGPEITTFSISTVANSINDFLAGAEKKISDYDGLALHQANRQIIRTIAKRVGASESMVPISLDRYANTSGASVPLTIADAYGDLNSGCLELLACAFGIGLSWGVASFGIDAKIIRPVFKTATRFEEGYMDAAR